jgi:hypothetical protein
MNRKFARCPPLPQEPTLKRSAHQQKEKTMDLYSTTDLNVLKAEIDRRYGVERGERPGPTSSLQIILRARAAEREHLRANGHHRSAGTSHTGHSLRAALMRRRHH